MNADQRTGEVLTQEQATFTIERGAELRDYKPTTPAEMEYFIREANGLLEQFPDVLIEINHRRYAAERAYSRKKNERMAELGKVGHLVAFARAEADVWALDELEAWHNTKAEYHYAEDTERALRTKVNSMLNINRAIAAQFGAHR